MYTKTREWLTFADVCRRRRCRPFFSSSFSSSSSSSLLLHLLLFLVIPAVATAAPSLYRTSFSGVHQQSIQSVDRTEGSKGDRKFCYVLALKTTRTTKRMWRWNVQHKQGVEGDGSSRWVPGVLRELTGDYHIACHIVGALHEVQRRMEKEERRWPSIKTRA